MKTIAYTGLGFTRAMVYLLCHDNYHFIEPEAYLADNLTHHQFLSYFRLYLIFLLSLIKQQLYSCVPGRDQI